MKRRDFIRLAAVAPIVGTEIRTLPTEARFVERKPRKALHRHTQTFPFNDDVAVRLYAEDLLKQATTNPLFTGSQFDFNGVRPYSGQ